MSHDCQRHFVIHRHSTPDGTHWDLMLEMQDLLRTWRLNIPPAQINDDPIYAEQIDDHSKRFLTYEGPVQNDTGEVKIVEHGFFHITEDTIFSLKIILKGQTLNGSFGLHKEPDKGNWEFKKIKVL